MSAGSEQHRHDQPAVPVLEEQRLGEILGAVPERAHWRYHPRRVGLVWRSRAFRAGAVIVTLAICGLLILALVREETGTEGFLVGLGLAVLPVPLLMAAFRWLDRVEPAPWRNLLFAFAWGSCAAALVAIVANSFATYWIANLSADPAGADTLGATVVAPIVEESAKGAAVLMLFLFRRREFNGIVDGIVAAGFTATGFAFSENILYLGNAFGEDRQLGTVGIVSLTVGTFFVRIVLSPFAHPVFTALTGIGFGLAAASRAGGRRRRVGRIALPLLGLLLAMGMHALWNSSATWGPYGFYLVYGAAMMPAFGLLTWLAIWSRGRELRTLAAEFPAYAMAGWLTPAEPLALASMRARGMARDLARHWHGTSDRSRGRAAARAVAEYESFATSLAALRRDARRGVVGGDFAAREQELLHHLWERRDVAAPALSHAARSVFRPAVRRPVPRPYGPGAHAAHGAHARGYAPPSPYPPRQQPWPAATGAQGASPPTPYGQGTVPPGGAGQQALPAEPQQPPPHRRYGGHNPYLQPPQ
ncbi:PrsW family glutamic-type intramembrane protease [Streptomyces sp. NPDC005576]|uniref:PrsW family glutamic-type intramembrane protease n=1 Tax=Streptomyces sp. NPDC005576 TaxID=3364726 RepID=UPI00368EFFAB